MVIPYEQVLKEIEELRKKSPEGFTVREMMAETGHHDNWCRQRIRELMDAGKVRPNGRRSVERIDGVVGYVPVYAFM